MSDLTPLSYVHVTNSSIKWDNLVQKDREIIIAVIFNGTPEEARKMHGWAHTTFYRRWGRLKGYYSELIRDFPKYASEILVSQSMKAAQELGRELDSDNEQIRQKAATQILDRTVAAPGTGLKRKLTLEEYEEREGMTPWTR